MDDSHELSFSDHDKRLYGRLDIAARDLHDAIAYGAFILKKGWNAKPWSRGTTYLQQSAFVTSMIISYGRAFTNSKGWGYLPDGFRELYDADETALHERIMNERHEIYAHSDSERYPIKPFKTVYHSDIIQYQFREIAAGDIARLQEMSYKIVKACVSEQHKIKAKYL